MAQRWVTEEEYNQMTQKFQEGGSPEQTNPLQEFFNQLPPELQEKIAVLPPEKQQEVLMQLLTKYNNSQGNVENNQQFTEGGEVDSQQIMQMVAQALQQNTPPEQIVQMLVEQGIPEEQAMQVIQQVMMQMQQQPEQEQQQFQDGGQTQGIPVEAERNENITVQDGQEPQVDGGYLEKQSYNPVTGQATYEIPDNGHNETHDNGGVNMELSEGDVVNSDKTKIPIDFKVYGKNFKNKTFKDASDYLSKQETKIQDDYTNKVKEGKTDKVSDGTLQIILAKLGKNRNELNELQEQVLESKKQKEQANLMNSQIAEYGKVVLGMNKAEQGFNSSLDRYLNYKVTDKPVLKAADGLNASLAKFEKFANQVNSNPNISIQDIKNAYKQSGLSVNSKNNNFSYSSAYQPINGSKIVGDFKFKIAQKETGGYKNPYIAIAGIGEKEASTHSFDELKSKAASSGLGKYQFIWNIHKNDIKRVTGITKPDDFRYNPQAQEQFMDWFRDTQLLPQATELKQKYNVPLSIEQLMAMVHLEGKGGLEKKIKAGTLKTSTMANNFKNASPLDYASNFTYGGKIYAQDGFNFSIWEGDKTTPGLNKADYTVDDLNFIAKNYFPNIKFESNKQLQEAIIPYLNENFGGYQEYVKPITPNAYKKQNLPNSLYDDKFGDDWNAAIKLLKENTLFPRPINSNAFTPAQDPWLPSQEIKEIPIESITNDDKIINGKTRDVIKKPAIGGVPEEETTSWTDKLKYGLKESLPYLRNLALLREKQFNPVLQQKSYDNPYDNMRTDYNIQSNLNDNQRALLTQMADTRGNPSVRNARMAQLLANTQNNNNQMYSQKYNQELALENQQTMGQSQYRGQLEDTNRGLRKQFEHEVLQTKEVGRQQKNMAIDNMMNDYLRKQEENQAIKLALMETNFDWNKFTQDYEANPEKMKKNFSLQKYLSKNSSGSDNSKIIEGADGESYEIITPKSGKPIIRKV
jgi:hypothetical protein